MEGARALPLQLQGTVNPHTADRKHLDLVMSHAFPMFLSNLFEMLVVHPLIIEGGE